MFLAPDGRTVPCRLYESGVDTFTVDYTPLLTGEGNGELIDRGEIITLLPECL